MTPEINTEFQLAADFVIHTSKNVFVTGKAGTGKTTFLQYIKGKTQKNTVIVAPTGVAAINAGGITMHSFFQLPFQPFVPERTGFGAEGNSYVDVHTFFQTARFNKAKINLYQELELLIIDEVSMLRCDYLDCIDTILRHHRRMIHVPFGGVQVVFIGDMFQLPPVVREWDLLSNYYDSPFFFSARVLKEQMPVYIELKKIYRQNETNFIQLLNKIRNNNMDDNDIFSLKELYHPGYDYKTTNDIVLTTHNNKATDINQEALQKLSGETYKLKGETTGDFDEREYPVDITLSLKIGAQVMFIKNDSSPEKRYYNGKIATVVRINDDSVTVRCKNEHADLNIEKEEWKKVRFVLNSDDDSIEEDVVGTFKHYPLRLAWAITIHKSQGLTFDKVVIDAGESFAAGQVYVALSRCTNMNGVILLSRITRSAISTDERIIHFESTQADNDSLLPILMEEMKLYQNIVLLKVFDWRKMLRLTDDLMDLLAEKSIQDKDKAIIIIRGLDVQNKTLYDTGLKFIPKIQYALQHDDHVQLSNLLQRAIPYYCQFILDNLIKPLQKHIEDVSKQKKVKAYLTFLHEVEQKWWKKIEQIEQLTFNQSLLYTGSSFLQNKATVAPIPPPLHKQKGDSHKESFELYQSGKTVAEIATIRNLATTTIEGHLAKFVETGELDIHKLVSLEKIKAIELVIAELGNEQITPLKVKLGDAYSYGEIRMVINYLRKHHT